MNLVKILLLFIKCCTGCVRPLHVNHEVIHFPLQPLLCLLQWSTLWVDSLNLLLWLLQALSKLLSAGWENQRWAKENSDVLRKWTGREFGMGEMGREQQKAVMVWTESIDRSLGWHSTLEWCIGWENTYPRGRLYQCGEEPETHFQYCQCKECDFSVTMINSIVNALEFSFL